MNSLQSLQNPGGGSSMCWDLPCFLLTSKLLLEDMSCSPVIPHSCYVTRSYSFFDHVQDMLLPCNNTPCDTSSLSLKGAKWRSSKYLRRKCNTGSILLYLLLTTGMDLESENHKNRLGVRKEELSNPRISAKFVT
ncbi:uncharacterized protein ACOB8E_022152 isoform 1-T4 [Sarcophilus harrisii]